MNDDEPAIEFSILGKNYSKHISLCGHAARNDDLEFLQMLRSFNPPSPWDESVCFAAAAKGHLRILQWLRSQDPPCPWDQFTCTYAIIEGHVDMFQWLRSGDLPCPIDINFIMPMLGYKFDVTIVSWFICFDRMEIYDLRPSTWYYEIMRPLHSMLVTETLEEIYQSESYNGDIVPKDVVRIIGSYANVSGLLFDNKAKTLMASVVLGGYNIVPNIPPQLLEWIRIYERL